MNWILPIAMEVRLSVLALCGALVAGVVNLAVYRLAWEQRTHSPWSRLPPGEAERKWTDRIPVAGWLGMRREEALHGRGFWVRPILVEIALALAFPLLYWWEVGLEGLLPPMALVPPAAHFASGVALATHAGVLSHLLLISLMVVASLIDLDERTIPDSVTVPGTLLGLALAAWLPWSLLPAEAWLDPGAGDAVVDFLRISSPGPWPSMLEAHPNTTSLAIACACWLLWCFALLPRRFVTRRGWGKGLQMFIGRLRRERSTYLIAAMAPLGAIVISAVWWRAAPAHWAGLLTALVGLAASGGLIWVVRIIGSAALGKEAMGFGDVTLMAMIGTFVGWQASLMIFFIAPFAGLIVGVLQWLVHRDQEIPYGPFLCMATAAVIVRWSALWQWAWGIFDMGWLVPAILVACMLGMGVMLSIWRMVREALFGTA